MAAIQVPLFAILPIHIYSLGDLILNMYFCISSSLTYTKETKQHCNPFSELYCKE